MTGAPEWHFTRQPSSANEIRVYSTENDYHLENQGQPWLAGLPSQGRHGEFEPGKAQYSTTIFLTGCFL